MAELFTSKAEAAGSTLMFGSTAEAADTPFTIETMRAAVRLMNRAVPPGGCVSRIFVSHYATEDGERLFPASRHRSRRIHKKLVRRFGGEFRQLPAMYRVGEMLMVHPALAAEVDRQLRRIESDRPANPLFGGIQMSWPRSMGGISLV